MTEASRSMNTEATFTVGLVQSRCTPDSGANDEATIAGVRSAAERGAQVVCLQELFRTPYFCQIEDSRNFDLAETVPGPSTDRFSALAAELAIVLIVPVFERRAPGLFHNSAAVIDADGSLLGVYRKMHIPDDPQYYEKFYFTPGDLGYRVFNTRFARVGVLILLGPVVPGGRPAHGARWRRSDLLPDSHRLARRGSRDCRFGPARRVADGAAGPRDHEWCVCGSGESGRAGAWPFRRTAILGAVLRVRPAGARPCGGVGRHRRGRGRLVRSRGAGGAAAQLAVSS